MKEAELFNARLTNLPVCLAPYINDLVMLFSFQDWFYYCGKHTLDDLTLTFIVLFSFSALVPMPNAIEKMIRRAVHLHDEKYATNRFGAGNTHKAPLALPSLGPDSKRILYTIYEYEPLLDSSNMTMDDWINIAKDLRVCNQFEDNTVHVLEQEYEILIVTLHLFL